MKKFGWSLLVTSVMLTPTAFAAESLPQKTPPSSQYLQWKQEQDALVKNGAPQSDILLKAARTSSGAVELFPTGDIPDPVDWSHLANNPPVPGGARGLDRAFDDPLPSSWDLRNLAWLPAVRSQSPFGTCWAHAAVGAAESNALTKALASPSGANAVDLSEMHLAWFAYGDSREGKSFSLNSPGADILNQGGNAAMAVAFLSRQGVVPEADMSYPTRTNYAAPAGTPEDYAPSFQLMDAYSLGAVNANNRNIVKRMIREYGAVHINYHSNQAKDYCPDNPSRTYGNCNGRTTYYTTVQSTNHAVLAVGWDDNFAKENFRPGERPANNGAWLVRNSWGADWGMGGYFWMSYEQYIGTGTVYIVEAADNRLRHYGHDDLGYTGSTLPQAWSANIFRAQNNEAVEEIAFHTTDNNVQYQAYVYDLGTTAPSSPTAGGVLLAQKSGSLPYAGYHRLALSTLAHVDAGHYFSVVVKMGSGSIALEDADYTPAVVNAGESWASSNGSSWTDIGARYNANTTIKAFTSVQAAGPVIDTQALPEGTVGEAYDAQLQASGTNITWTLDSGALPRGLNLAAAGRISGTPTEAGTYGFTVKATNSTNRSTTKTLSIRIKDNSAATAPVITTAALPNAALGAAYSYTLEATGTTPITWTASSKPAWMSVSSDGKITGTPTAAGTFSVTLTARNNAGTSAPKSLTVKVGSAPMIATGGLPNGTVGTAYNALLVATGTTPITWTKVSGNLPGGLGISGDRISGTPSAQGSFTFTLQASNEWGNATKTLTITVSGAAVAPTITTTSLPNGTVGAAYSHTLAATGTAPITWSASGLPNGLSISGDRISGTPTQAGTFQVTLTARNSVKSVSKTMTLSVSAGSQTGAAPVITTRSLPNGSVGTPYGGATLTASGTQPITWTPLSGLPPGLTLSQNGAIGGTPTSAGTFSFTVQARNDWGTSMQTLSIIITDGAVQAPVITTDTLPNGTVGQTYNATLAISGAQPITLSVQGLPSWLTLYSNGLLSGRPTQAGTYTFTVRAENAAGSVTKTFRIVVAAAAVEATPLPAGKLNEAYSVWLQVTGTSGAVVWGVSSGRLPDGVYLNSNGELYGRPTQTGTFTFTARAMSSNGAVGKVFSITVTQ